MNVVDDVNDADEPIELFTPGIAIIEGPIGVGKSTLCDSIAEYAQKKGLNVLKIGNDKYPFDMFRRAIDGGYVVIIYEESIANPYLEKFYSDMQKYAYVMQKHMHSKREEGNSIAGLLKGAGNRVIQDRSIFSDEVFYFVNEEHMTNSERQKYWKNRQSFLSKCNMPDIAVYLGCSAETCVERVLSRSIDCEKSIPVEYHQDVINIHEDKWKGNMQRIGCKVVELDWGNSNKYDKDSLYDMILKGDSSLLLGDLC